MGVDTTSLCSADKCLKRVCRCVTSHSRSATRSHRLLTSSTLRRLVPPLSPLAHEPRGGPIKDPFILCQLKLTVVSNFHRFYWTYMVHPLKCVCVCKFSVTAALLLCVTCCDKICKYIRLIYSLRCRFKGYSLAIRYWWDSCESSFVSTQNTKASLQS